MTYPSPVYDGERGEVTARFRPADTLPDVSMTGSTWHFLATTAGTGGRFTAYRVDLGPERTDPRPHFHRTFSESFFMLSGALALYDGARWRDMTSGDFAYVAEGGLHTFRNESGAPASMLILFAPGVPIEGYVERLAAVSAGTWSPTEDELRELRLEHDQNFVDQG